MEFYALKVNGTGIPRHKANNSSVLGHLPFAVESYTYAVLNGDILYHFFTSPINSILGIKFLQRQRQGNHANII